MPISVGTGPGQYPPVVQYVVNGEPADDFTFNRPTTDLDGRTEVLRTYVDAMAIANVAGLSAALGGSAPLHANLGKLTLLDYAGNLNKIFSIDGAGNPVLISNTLQGENNTASNLGSGQGQVFVAKVGVDLQLRSLKAGVNMTITQTSTEILLTAAPGEINRFTKPCKNTTGADIPANVPVAWLDDGTIALADANVKALSDICGVTAQIITDGNFGLVGKFGNMPAALVGLGATPGQYIYLGETPGTFSLTPPPGLTDNIVALGRAEPPDGVATGTAEDLFLTLSYVSEGGVP